MGRYTIYFQYQDCRKTEVEATSLNEAMQYVYETVVTPFNGKVFGYAYPGDDTIHYFDEGEDLECPMPMTSSLKKKDSDEPSTKTPKVSGQLDLDFSSTQAVTDSPKTNVQ